MSSSSTDGVTPWPADDVSLHEELRGSSLQSSRVASRLSNAVAPSPFLEDLSTVLLDDNNDEEIQGEREFIFSSPHLPLPPPFSAVTRTVSGLEALPSHMPASPIRSRSSTPVRTEVEGERPTWNSSPALLEDLSEVDSLPSVRKIIF